MVGKEVHQEKLSIEKAKKISIAEGSFNGITEGVGRRYITPYAISLGANNIQIGFLSSLPLLLGNFTQLLTLRLMRKFSRKKIIMIGAFIEALMWLPIIALGFLMVFINLKSDLASVLLIIIYSILMIHGTITVPAWSSWMKDLVTEKSGAYFAMRTRIIELITLTSILIAGFVLDFFRGNKVFFGFAILFAVAFIARLVSVSFFKNKYEPHFKHREEHHFTLFDFIKKMLNNNFGRFVLFVSLMSVAVWIASPFFAVYMLKELNLSYANYTLIVVASSLTSILFFPFWGKFSDLYGNLKVLKICSWLICLIPLLWLPSVFLIKSNPGFLVPYLIAVEALSGACWAGYNLSSSNFVYDAVTREKMAHCFTYFNILRSIGFFIGSLAGGLILTFSITLFILTPILVAFLLSGVLRILINILLMNKVREVREVKILKKQDVLEKLNNMYPEEMFRMFR